jgi:La-related protein 7
MAFFIAGPPLPPFEYFTAAVGPGGGGGGFGPAVMAEQEAEAEMVTRDGIFDDAVHKVRKQVCGCSSLRCCLCLCCLVL